jgi:hypothetical protein
VEQVGGPSVKPYQPDGLWKEIASDTHYEQAKGPALYRRSLYTYWKRTVAPPTMSTFDAPGRESCTVRETRTNTPLQALALMNDVTYIEAARVLGERMLKLGGEDGLRWGFRRVTSRQPGSAEEEILRRALRSNLADFRKNPEAAKRLIATGDSKPDASLDPARAGRHDDGREPDPEPRRSGDEGIAMDPVCHLQEIERRRFLMGAGLGVGAMAVATMLKRDVFAQEERLKQPQFAPRAKRVIYLCQSGAPSQMDLFDHKPALEKYRGGDLPDSVRMGQRFTGMTATQERFPIAPTIFKFAQRGRSGAWVSDLLPHTAKIVGRPLLHQVDAHGGDQP